MSEALSLDRFEQAYETVRKVTLDTSLIFSDYLTEKTGGKVYLNFLVTTLTGDEQVFPVDVTDRIDTLDNVISIDSLIIPQLSETPYEGYNPTVDDWDDEVIDVPIK